jgi:hypothetical protein
MAGFSDGLLFFPQRRPPPCIFLLSPHPRQPIVGQCQVHCGGVSANDDDSLCKCDGSSTPPDCLWDRCTPYPSNSSAPGGAPFCCCASIDIKMQWVGAESLRRTLSDAVGGRLQFTHLAP